MGLFSSDEPKSDAIALLTDDHRKVQALFNEFRSLKEDDGGNEQKAELVQQICAELAVHALIEEEIFYPAVRKAIDDDDLMDEADVEHASAKALIIELMTGAPGVGQFDAKATVLGEFINHHVKEEESEMFPKARKSVDVAALGKKMAARKAELLAEMAREGDGAQAQSRGKGGRKAAQARRT
jgi:hemerythrin superfamily protein